MSRILLIEDDYSVRSMVRRILARAGYDVIEAANGKEGIQLLGGNQVDLLITDLIMPEMDGIELIKNVQATNPKLAILAVSGGGVRTLPHVYLRMAEFIGASKVLAKPFEIEALLAAVKELVGS